MTDPSKSQPTWSFGTTGNKGDAANTNTLLGQNASSTSNAPSATFFGTATNVSGTSTPSLFGGQSNTQQGSSLFGGPSSTTQGPSLFGGGTKDNQGTSPFGGGSSAQQGSTVFGSVGTGTALGNNPGTGNQSTGFTFGQNKPQLSTSAQNQTSNTFGAVSSAGSSTLFGNAGGGASSAPAFGAQTPTSKSPGGFNFGGPSTTPAGPPPANALGFSVQRPQDQTGGSFGLEQPKSSGQDKAFAAATSSNLLSGSKPYGGLFQSVQTSEAPANTSTSASTPSMFSNNSGGNIFGNRPEAQFAAIPSNNLGNLSTGKTSSDMATSTPQQSGAEAPKPLFTNLGAESAASSASGKSNAPSLFLPKTQTTDSQRSALNFVAPTPKSAESNTPTTNAPNLFASLSGQKSSTASTPAPAPASSSNSNMFANLGKAPEKSSEAKVATTTAAVKSLASAPPLSLGSSEDKPAATTSAKESANVASSNAANLENSTTGPPPTAQSRLKNKSMDEIITRWASDLSKYQKEFQRQAEKIAGWDRMLVENSDKIQKLYGSTLEAQRATAEVERQLTMVENEQNELEIYLEAYESQVAEMMQAQGAQEESLQGPDKERQETYELAERLTERLDEMGKDLTSMIEEINDASSSLNKSSKPDDPLSQVVRVLNSHLTQLQQIDQGTAALQMKVAAAQKASQGFGSLTGYNGPTSDAADSFYRSYMGRR